MKPQVHNDLNFIKPKPVHCLLSSLYRVVSVIGYRPSEVRNEDWRYRVRVSAQGLLDNFVGIKAVARMRRTLMASEGF